MFLPPPQNPRSMFQSVDTFEGNGLKYADRKISVYIGMPKKCQRHVIQYK